LRLVQWNDPKGNVKRWSWIRNEDPDEFAPSGIPVTAPDLSDLDWESMRREMQDALESHNLFSWQDVQKSGLGFSPCLTILKRYLHQLYRTKEIKQ
jgi:hypothetical protein